MQFKIASIAALVGIAAAHMELTDPCPRFSPHCKTSPTLPAGASYDYNNMRTPIAPDGELCKSSTPWPEPVAQWTAGQSVTVEFEKDGAAHGGGHCQFSLSYDGGKNFVVIHEELKYCFFTGPSSGNDATVTSYTFNLPATVPNSDNVIFSWSWVNAIGNREFYHNCADITISGSSSSSYTGKRMVIANHNGYTTIPEFNDNYDTGLDLYQNAEKITVSGGGYTAVESPAEPATPAYTAPAGPIGHNADEDAEESVSSAPATGEAKEAEVHPKLLKVLEQLVMGQMQLSNSHIQLNDHIDRWNNNCYRHDTHMEKLLEVLKFRFDQEGLTPASIGMDSAEPCPCRSAGAEAPDSYYADLGRRVRGGATGINIEGIWTSANISGKDAWASRLQPDGAFSDQAVEAILATYRRSYKENHGSFDPEEEGSRRAAVAELFGSIEAHCEAVFGEDTRICWRDTEDVAFTGGEGQGRKPDGVLSSMRSGRNMPWHRVAAIIELKYAGCSLYDNRLRGKLARDFIDMAADQPRRYTVGLGMSKGCMLQLYVCTPGGLYCARAGTLPGPVEHKLAERDADHRLVRTILATYKELSDDTGFLVKTGEGFYDIFGTNSISGLVRAEGSAATIIPRGDIFGRRGQLFGTRSWMRSARCTVNDAGPMNCYVKFSWVEPKDTSAGGHKVVAALGLPNIPPILYDATVVFPGTDMARGEFLVIGDVGDTLDKRFAALVDQPQAFVDVVAGYVFTMFRAATGDGTQFVLHRDISVGSLLVDEDNRPWITGWDSALVAQSAGERSVSAGRHLGTPVFMSIRALAGMDKRSVIDDLESLFLAVSYCAWGQYGQGRDRDSLWNKETTQEDLVRGRVAWFSFDDEYLACMGLGKGCPDYLVRLLGNLRRLLLPVANIRAIRRQDIDPRIEAFDARKWVLALKIVLNLKSIPKERMPQLYALDRFVAETPGCCCPYTNSPLPELSSTGAAVKSD
ncbi:hypothetical protein GGF46_002029 [Coemansia sp. RSA 552]|nr:hypothetical protein GGF46_002029 [Coemansia sp. RSA 552]